MKKYEVTLYYHTSVAVEVEAKNEKEAIEKAYVRVSNPEWDEVLLENLSEDDEPDVELIEE